MNEDLKLIKKKYGEDMAKWCREIFPTLLEKEGLLPKLLTDNFYPSRFLYKDIISNRLEDDFKNYIFDLVDVEKEYKIEVKKTPKQLLDEAGYILYECHNEQEIQNFKKYYAPGEELCTFRGERLNRCHVFFAVKKDVDNIKREDFRTPNRQDLYGTSVISIQFTRDQSHTLSIKNRYNHHVNNPDSTFSNNLDNIIPGLTESFAREYGLIQRNRNKNFEIPGYVKANDNRYYKYNYEIYNIYYCPDNIIIDNFEAKQLEKEKYVLLDYFVLDLQEKTIKTYDSAVDDSFSYSMENVEKIKIEKTKDKKILFLKETNGNIVTIILDDKNRIVGYKNDKLRIIEESFLGSNESLEEIELKNVEIIGNCFLYDNISLKRLELPKVKEIRDDFLANNKQISEIKLPQVEIIGDNFLYDNISLKTLEIPRVKKIGGKFLFENDSLLEIKLPQVETIEDDFLFNSTLKILELPKVKKVGRNFLHENAGLLEIKLPQVETIEDDFLFNSTLKILELPKVKKVGRNFLHENAGLLEIKLPQVEIIGDNFLMHGDNLERVELPNVETIGHSFLLSNNKVKTISFPKCRIIGAYFFNYNECMQKVELPKIEGIGMNFLWYSPRFKKSNVEELRQQGILQHSEESGKRGKK